MMRITVLMVIVALLSTCATAQSLPPQVVDAAPKASSVEPQPSFYTAAESQLRIREAGELLRAGDLARATERLDRAGLDAAVDPRDTDMASALLSLKYGDPRGAFERADAVLAAKKGGWCNVDAALLKSIIYLKVGIAPSAIIYARLADQLHPHNAAAAGIIRRMRSAGLDEYRRVSSSVHPRESGYRITIWKTESDALQPLVATFLEGSRFVGALTVESLKATEGARNYAIYLRDFEANPLLIHHLGGELPTPEAFLAFAEQFCPTKGPGGYSVMRAEAECLVWRELGIEPLAALWAEYAAEADSRIARLVGTEIQRAGSGRWNLALDTTNRDGAQVLGYVNSKATEHLGDNNDKRIVAHLIVYDAQRSSLSKHLVVQTERLLDGQRVFCLLTSDPQPRVLAVYDELPEMDVVAQRIDERVSVEGTE